MDRPIGTFLVYYPSLAGLAMVAPTGSLPDLGLSALFLAGAFLMRGAGCTVNDMWDRRFDASVSRTKDRPLASGALGMGQATGFLAAQLGLGLGCLLQLNPATGALGVACLPLVALYPALKRVTYFPQVALGFAMNWGMLMAATAVQGGGKGSSMWEQALLLTSSGGGGGNGGSIVDSSTTANLPQSVTDAMQSLSTTLHEVFLAGGSPHCTATLPLFVGGVLWTVVYDTLYAHQDRKEDAALGLRSTALLLGVEHSRVVLSLAGVGMGVAWVGAGVEGDMAWPYYVGVLGATGHVLWQVGSAAWDDRGNLGARFVSNARVGGGLAVACILGRVMGG